MRRYAEPMERVRQLMQEIRFVCPALSENTFHP
jgi:hypothetical protein